MSTAIPAATHLFSPLTQRGITLPNRIAVSPMCQYSSDDGFASDWHLVHLGSRAVGGAGMVMTEAAAISPEGRISPQDLGIWKDEHIEPLARITRFIREQASVPAIQLAHAGRKASMTPAWEKPRNIPPSEGGWENVVGPSAVPYSATYAKPHEMDRAAMDKVLADMTAATKRAAAAGFQLAEIHAAHGYLAHEFVSPLSNHRTDEYGGSLANRTRFPLEIVRAARAAWPEDMPLWVRISATDWVDGGLTLDDTVEFARMLKAEGVDMIDVSSGGNDTRQQIPIGPGYQVAFAERIRRDAGIATAAVGMITGPAQADQILRSGQADVVLLAREMLREPYWPLRAAFELKHPASWLKQYERAAPGPAERRKTTEGSAAKVGEDQDHCDGGSTVEIRVAVLADFEAITEIYNEVVLHSTATYNETPATVDERVAWWRSRQAQDYPVLVAVEDDAVVGFASFGDFRAWPGYRYTVEGTIHLAPQARGRGLGRQLLDALVEQAKALGKHIMIAGVDSENAASLRFLTRYGFQQMGQLQEVGYKFGRYLNLVFLQYWLTPRGEPPSSEPSVRGATAEPPHRL